MKLFHSRIAIFLSFVPLLSASALEREKSVSDCAGEVVTVKGTVLLRQEGDDEASPKKFIAKKKLTDKKSETSPGETITLKPGNNVYAGDVINTASDGAVKILLKDKTIVDLGGSAMFKVAQYKPNEGANRQVELDMMFGKMRVAVPKRLEGEGKFQIKTHAATMGVRGTEFVVASSSETANEHGVSIAPQTSVTVLQGKVDVAKPGTAGAAATAPIHLTAGSQLIAQVGALPTVPVKLNQTQLTSVSKASKVSDNTFTKAVTIESAPPQRTAASAASATASNSKSANAANSRAPADANSTSSTSTSGAPLAGSLQGAVAAIAAEVPTVSVSFSELGVPGAPSVVNAATPVTPTKSTYHVTVVVAQ